MSNRAFVAGVAAIVGLAVVLLVATVGLAQRPVPTPTPSPASRWEVYVSGAVASPGVYVVHPGDRVADAIQAAGGASPDADLAYVNPAMLLRDGQRVHVPRRGGAADAHGR